MGKSDPEGGHVQSLNLYFLFSFLTWNPICKSLCLFTFLSSGDALFPGKVFGKLERNSRIPGPHRISSLLGIQVRFNSFSMYHGYVLRDRGLSV